MFFAKRKTEETLSESATVLGDGCRVVPAPNGNRRILCIGGTYNDIKESVVKPSLREDNPNLLIMDPDGTLYDEMSRYLRDHGFETKIFDPKHTYISCTYNPMAHLQDENGKPDQMKVRILAEMLERELTRVIDWDPDLGYLVTTGFLCRVITHVLETQPKENHNLAFASGLTKKAAKRIRENKIPFSGITPAVSEKTKEKSLLMAVAALSEFENRPYRDIVRSSKNEIMFGKTDKKQAVFVVLPESEGISKTMTDRDKMYRFLRSTMISQAIAASVHDDQNKEASGYTDTAVRIIASTEDFSRVPHVASEVAKRYDNELDILAYTKSETRFKGEFRKAQEEMWNSFGKFVYLDPAE